MSVKRSRGVSLRSYGTLGPTLPWGLFHTRHPAQNRGLREATEARACWSDRVGGNSHSGMILPSDSGSLQPPFSLQ